MLGLLFGICSCFGLLCGFVVCGALLVLVSLLACLFSLVSRALKTTSRYHVFRFAENPKHPCTQIGNTWALKYFLIWGL